MIAKLVYPATFMSGYNILRLCRRNLFIIFYGIAVQTDVTQTDDNLSNWQRIPEQWGTHTWNDGTRESHYKASMKDCTFHIDKAGVYNSNSTTIHITVTCASEQLFGKTETEGDEVAFFRTKAGDFEWDIESPSCGIHFMYHSSNILNEWTVSHLSCNRWDE